MNGAKILAIDQGTTSTRAMVFSDRGDVLDMAQRELKLGYPENGWVEQNPDDIWVDTLACIRDVVGRHPECVVAGITNQRETTILWDRKTGRAIYNAIVWQDRRTADFCAELKAAGCGEMVTRKTGLLLDSYFSATKIRWILDHVNGAREAAQKGDLAFGTIDCFLLWHLTGGKVHATDVSNASRTMLMDIHTCAWDDELLDLFDIPRSLLPEIHENVSAFGHFSPEVCGVELPVGGMAGDQQAALIGQACFTPGMTKATYGTGCFALMNIGATPKLSKNKLLTSVGYKINGQTSYVLEGSIFVAGAAIQWLRDNMGMLTHAGESESLARSVPDTNGVYFVPAFTGLGAPYWNPHVRGAIFGLTRDTSKAHIVRAALEAQVYQTCDLMHSMQKDSGVDLKTMRVDGGLVSNAFMTQFLSDMLSLPIDVPKCTETTALGAAYLAGLRAGVYDSLDDIAKIWALGTRYTPTGNPDHRQKLYAGWGDCVGRLVS